MKIELIDRTTAKITLTEQDLDDMAITYDEMDYKSPDTIRAILDLVDRVKVETGIDFTSSKLFVEAYPVGYGGCVLYINLLEQGREFLPEEPSAQFQSPFLFSFESLDYLLRANAALFRQYSHLVHKSSLYQMTGQYYLAIQSYRKLDDKLIQFLGEFGSFYGRGDIKISFLEEHGKSLIEDTAMEILAELAY